MCGVTWLAFGPSHFHRWFYDCALLYRTRVIRYLPFPDFIEDWTSHLSQARWDFSPPVIDHWCSICLNCPLRTHRIQLTPNGHIIHMKAWFCDLLLPVCWTAPSVSRQLEKFLDDRCGATQIVAWILLQPRPMPEKQALKACWETVFILRAHRALRLLPEWRSPAWRGYATLSGRGCHVEASGGWPKGGKQRPGCLEEADWGELFAIDLSGITGGDCLEDWKEYRHCWFLGLCALATPLVPSYSQLWVY